MHYDNDDDDGGGDDGGAGGDMINKLGAGDEARFVLHTLICMCLNVRW